MARIIDTTQVTVFSAITGGFVLAYSLFIFMTRSSFQFGSSDTSGLGSKGNSYHRK